MPCRAVRCFLGLGLLGLSACMSISPAGMIAASRVDPLAMPADQVSVAVGVPQAVRLAPGDAVMRIAFRGGAAAATVMIAEEVPLQLMRDAAGTIRANAADEVVYLASLLPQDAARFSDAQARIRDARASGVEGVGTLNIEIVGGCHTGPAPAELPASTWLRTDPSGAFVPLTRRADAFGALAGAGGGPMPGTLSPC